MVRGKQSNGDEEANGDGEAVVNRPATDQPSPEPSARRRWMRLLAVVLGLLPLLVIEVGLRLVGDSAVEAVDYDPLVDMEQLRPLFVLDESSGRWAIPPERMNFFRPASFAAVKPPGTKRVFVLGGSTVQGRPYATETSFSTSLQFRLQASSPGDRFEVINCGGVSYASYRVARILDEVLRHEPDAVVLYTGHNEFLEDRTYAEARSLGPVRRWVSRAGSRLHTVRWLKRLTTTQEFERTTLKAEVDARLDHSGGLAGYQRDDSWRQGVHDHFDATFRRMVRATRQADVPLVVCLPASDLVGTPPIKSLPLGTLSASQRSKFDAAWSRATDPALTRTVRQQACKRCLAIDGEHAGAHYVAGRLALEDGDTGSALAHLVSARDHDVCPLRATSAILASIVEITGEENVPLVDTMTMFDQRGFDASRTPDGIIDREFFVDHIHPTIAGHQRLGVTVASRLASIGLIDTPDPDIDAIEQRYGGMVGEHLSTLDESYYARGKQRLEGLRKWATGRAGDIGLSH